MKILVSSTNPQFRASRRHGKNATKDSWCSSINTFDLEGAIELVKSLIKSQMETEEENNREEKILETQKMMVAVDLISSFPDIREEHISIDKWGSIRVDAKDKVYKSQLSLRFQEEGHEKDGGQSSNRITYLSLSMPYDIKLNFKTKEEMYQTMEKIGKLYQELKNITKNGVAV